MEMFFVGFPVTRAFVWQLMTSGLMGCKTLKADDLTKTYHYFI